MRKGEPEPPRGQGDDEHRRQTQQASRHHYRQHENFAARCVRTSAIHCPSLSERVRRRSVRFDSKKRRDWLLLRSAASRLNAPRRWTIVVWNDKQIVSKKRQFWAGELPFRSRPSIQPKKDFLPIQFSFINNKCTR